MAVIETRLTHNFHRGATALLVEASTNPAVPVDALMEFRDFLVAHLRDHHESEDHELWHHLNEVAPETASGLAELTEEHEGLEAALEALSAVREGDRDALRDAAAAVRDFVIQHLDHEEPLLFPALRDKLPPETWAQFSQKVIANSPQLAPHLLIGFFDRVGTPEEVALILSGLPGPVQELVPMLREQGRAALAVLSGSAA